MTQDTLLSQIKKDLIFGYVQCDIEVPKDCQSQFSNFPLIFKNVPVGRSDIGDLMRQYAIENKLLQQPQRMLISSFHLKNGIIITPLLKFYLSLGLSVHEFIVSFSTRLKSASILSFNQLLMLAEAEMRILIQVLLQRL